MMIVCVCLMLLGFSTIDLPRMLNRALVLLFWYHLGYMTHTYLEPQKGNIENKKETVITAALSIGILIIGIRGGGQIGHDFRGLSFQPDVQELF